MPVKKHDDFVIISRTDTVINILHIIADTKTFDDAETMVSLCDTLAASKLITDLHTVYLYVNNMTDTYKKLFVGSIIPAPDSDQVIHHPKLLVSLTTTNLLQHCLSTDKWKTGFIDSKKLDNLHVVFKHIQSNVTTGSEFVITINK